MNTLSFTLKPLIHSAGENFILCSQLNLTNWTEVPHPNTVLLASTAPAPGPIRLRNPPSGVNLLLKPRLGYTGSFGTFPKTEESKG